MNILNLINNKFQFESNKDLIFLDEQQSLDEKNRFLIPSKIKKLFSNNSENLIIKIHSPYPHIILLPYQNEIKNIIN
jgi:DNA-binding transcriptional regulator/RsmH inhibitor MraZ